MATFIFNGTSNLSIPNFDPTVDTIVIEGFDVADVASFTQTNDAVPQADSSVNLTLTSGVVLSLGGVLFSSLTSANFNVNNATSDIFLEIEDGDVDGNIIVSQAAVNTLTIDGDDAFAYGQQGNDTIDGGGAAYENATIFAGQGDDDVSEFGNGSIVYGNAGADIITAEAGAAGDSVTVFGGSNTVGALDGADTITGGDGDDLLYGNVGADVLNGLDGDDTIFGGQDNDDILGGDGDDTLYGNLGGDEIDGEDGNDTIFGGQGDDVLTGGLGDDAVYGNLDNDTITASAGVDTLVGGAGDDTITGALDEGSLVYGGLDDDTVTVSVVSTADGETTSIFGGNGIVGAEDGDDTITVANNGDGNVVVGGNLGNDTITVEGTGTGATTVFGGDGDDTIAVDALDGNVTLTGGLGVDGYTFAAGASDADDGNIDTITDFNFDEDTIALGATSVSTVTIQDAADLAAIQAFGSAAAGAATVINVTGGDFAGSYLTNGDTLTADTFINITGFTGTVDEAALA